MIAFGDEGSSVISGSVRLAPGLGLTNRFIIDQHFRERDRFSSMDSVTEGQPVCMLGLRLHILVAGATYNMHTRMASAGALAQRKE